MKDGIILFHFVTINVFKNLTEDVRLTLHNHTIPSNNRHDQVAINAVDVIQSRLNLKYPSGILQIEMSRYNIYGADSHIGYTFKNNDDVTVTLGDVYMAAMYA